MTTISDVAKKASVGLGTVSRVLSGNGSVSDTTRKRVLKVMEELEYQPNSIARSLATNRSNSIGLVVPEFKGSYFGRLITAAENELRADSRHVIIANGAGCAKEEVAAVDFLRHRSCDGLLLNCTEMSDKAVLGLAEKFPKIAIINRTIRKLSESCFVSDNRFGGTLAARCLLDAGHKKFASITGPLANEEARHRQAGFERELKKAGIRIETMPAIEGDNSYASGASCVEQLWKKRRKITALFCGNDEMAVGAMFKLQEMGVRVPHDVSVIGFDDANLSERTYPKLTTISNPIEELTQNATRYIRNKCYKQSNPVVNKIKPHLIEGETVMKPGRK